MTIVKKISELQDALQNEFEHTFASPINSAALDPLRRKINGRQLTVTVREHDKKKRSNASVDSWSPDSGQIVLSWTSDVTADLDHLASQPSHAISARAHLTTSIGDSLSERVQDLCGVLGEVEREGRSFIALKWFRDTVLSGKSFNWARTAESRQAVLARAIEQGAILTRRIPNPHAAQFPTTTIALNRSRSGETPGGLRYSPIRVKGEPVSATLLHDRGAR
jgi:hypothetical protein